MSAAVEKRDGPDPLLGMAAGRERFTAFVADEASERTVRQCVTEMALSFSSVHRGNVKQAVAHLESSRSPTALLVDISGTELPVNQINHLAEVCEPGVAVAVIGDRNDIGLYRDLIQAGISDYLVKPLSRSLVQTTIESLIGITASAPVPVSQKTGRIVGVFGGRGGVGATTIAVNVAWHLANKESRRVALVDLDIHYGDCALALDVKLVGGLREVLENPQRLDDLFLDRALVRCSDRLFLLAAEERLDLPTKIDPNALAPLFELLRKQFHYVIVDIPRGHGLFMQQMMELASTRLIVTDQTAHGIRDTVRLRPFFDAPHQGQRNLVVLNRVGEQGKSDIDIKIAEGTLGMPIDVMIPFHPKTVVAAANAGMPVADAKGPMANAIVNISNALSGRHHQDVSAKRSWLKSPKFAWAGAAK